MKKELYQEVIKKQSEAVDFDFPIILQHNHILVDKIHVSPVEKLSSGLYLPQQSLEGLKVTDKGFGKEKIFKDSATQIRKEQEDVNFDTHPFQGIVVSSNQLSISEEKELGIQNKDLKVAKGDYIYLKPKWFQYAEPVQIEDKVYFVIYPDLILGVIDLKKIKVEE